jgi:hypothetical protein
MPIPGNAHDPLIEADRYIRYEDPAADAKASWLA